MRIQNSRRAQTGIVHLRQRQQSELSVLFGIACVDFRHIVESVFGFVLPPYAVNQKGVSRCGRFGIQIRSLRIVVGAGFTASARRFVICGSVGYLVHKLIRSVFSFRTEHRERLFGKICVRQFRYGAVIPYRNYVSGKSLKTKAFSAFFGAVAINGKLVPQPCQIARFRLARPGKRNKSAAIVHHIIAQIEERIVSIGQSVVVSAVFSVGTVR